MEQIVDSVITELRQLIRDLGKDGGLISPSVYDTAQVMRFYPPKEGTGPALEWLLSQQQADGGWGDPAVPLARDMPTMAAILALHECGEDKRLGHAAKAGIDFLLDRGDLWKGILPNDIPVAAELIIPNLLDEWAKSALPQLESIRGNYPALLELGVHRRMLLSQANPKAGTPASFSWEAWGTRPDPEIVDQIGSVGHSPAATAAWLNVAQFTEENGSTLSRCRRYLDNSAAATRTGIPGVYPTAWPIDRFEQAFGLFALYMSGIIDHPSLRDLAFTQAQELANVSGERGIGFSDYFDPDGDNTAAVMAVALHLDIPVDISALTQFEGTDFYKTYPHELQPSISVTARALKALTSTKSPKATLKSHLISLQAPDGKWYGDKWNSSWLYTTSHVILALNGEGSMVTESTIDAILHNQHACGGWGSRGIANAAETAFAILALNTLEKTQKLDFAMQTAKANRWLAVNQPSTSSNGYYSWLNKELYSPYNVDRTFVLAALLSRYLMDTTSE